MSVFARILYFFFSLTGRIRIVDCDKVSSLFHNDSCQSRSALWSPDGVLTPSSFTGWSAPVRIPMYHEYCMRESGTDKIVSLIGGISSPTSRESFCRRIMTSFKKALTWSRKSVSTCPSFKMKESSKSLAVSEKKTPGYSQWKIDHNSFKSFWMGVLCGHSCQLIYLEKRLHERTYPESTSLNSALTFSSF